MEVDTKESNGRLAQPIVISISPVQIQNLNFQRCPRVNRPSGRVISHPASLFPLQICNLLFLSSSPQKELRLRHIPRPFFIFSLFTLFSSCNQTSSSSSSSLIHNFIALLLHHDDVILIDDDEVINVNC